MWLVPWAIIAQRVRRTSHNMAHLLNSPQRVYTPHYPSGLTLAIAIPPFQAATSSRQAPSGWTRRTVDGAGLNGHRGVEVHILNPSASHNCTVILLHGLGDSASGWSPVVDQIFAPALPSTRFILPSAPVQPVTLCGGETLPSW